MMRRALYGRNVQLGLHPTFERLPLVATERLTHSGDLTLRFRRKFNMLDVRRAWYVWRLTSGPGM